MGIWSSLARRAGRMITYPIAHPQRALGGLGTTTKTAVVGGGLGYVAWQNIVNDKPVVRTVADVVVGEDTVNKATEIVSGAVDGVGNVVSKAGDAVSDVGNALSGANGSGGLGNFFQGLFSGNGLGMIGDFFSNLGKGNVSGLSIAGLIASAFLIFGRFGWLGKIAGAILGMMVIGNNFNMSRIMGGGSQQPDARFQGQQLTERQMPTMQPAIQQEPVTTIHRGR